MTDSAGRLDLSRVVEDAPEVRLIVDPAGTVLLAGDRYLSGVGLDRAQVIGRSLFDLPPYANAPASAQQLRQALAIVASSGIPAPHELPDTQPGTSGAHWMAATNVALRDHQGSLLCIRHELQTETARHHEVRDRERELRKLFHDSREVIALTDAQARIVFVTPSIRHVLGWDEEAFMHGPPMALMHPEDAPRFGEGVNEIFAHPGGVIEMRVRARHFDGRYRMLECTVGNRLHDPDVAALVVTFRDVTDQADREVVERRAQEGQKLESLGVLAGGIAHDFNNILMTVLGNASLIQSSLSADSNVLPFVAQIEEAARRAAELCRQMLAYAGKGRFLLTATDLNELVEATTHLLQVSISKKAVLRFHLHRNLPRVVVDATQIRQVLMNFVINASDAIGERSGVISISTGIVRADRAYLEKTFLAPEIPEGDYVYLEVSDTGGGMSGETQARIFEPFYSTKFTGRGLGLAAVLGIVRGHKGALKVYSELGKGSSFKFLLPVTDDAWEPTPRPITDRPLSARGTIMVVDDEETVLAVAAKMLEQLGFEVITASDGREAVSIFRTRGREIAAVLMDLTMPHLDGEQTFHELRRIDPDIRVLLMSGYNEQDAIARFVGKGLAGFVQKPFGMNQLRDTLRTLLG